MKHAAYAKDPAHYVRAFLVLQNDLLKLFEYIEPSDSNHGAYSFRTHELLLRAAVEVEANCKAILSENGYAKLNPDYWNIKDYAKVNATHHLSSYEVLIPVWKGLSFRRRPFATWANSSLLPWYTAYNQSKHDRHSNFDKATFQHVVDAICGVLVLLSSQFMTEDFAGGDDHIVAHSEYEGELGIGQRFRVKFPNDWVDADRYDFNWEQLKQLPNPIQSHVYPV